MPGQHGGVPCPYNILHDTGYGFVLGATGGAIWHGIKGARNAPRGVRLEGALIGMKARSPVVAGNFAAWTALLSGFNCLATEVRQKEDGWNWVIAGAGAGGCLSARSGPRAALGGAIGGGVMMGVFEGIGIWLEHVMAQGNKPIAPEVPAAPTTST